MASIEANDPAASGAPGPGWSESAVERALSTAITRGGANPPDPNAAAGVYSVRQDPADRSSACVHPESATSSGPLFRLALHQGAEVVASSPGGSWTKVIARPTVTRMGNRRLDVRAFGLLVTLLVLIGAAFLWMRRRRWTDHDVSDPGVTL